MLAANTLMALACLIGNKGRLDTAPVENQLTSDEKAQVQKYIDAGACLPEAMEQRVHETENKILKKQMPNISGEANPTHDCD